MDTLESIFETYKMHPHEAAKKSTTWFNQQLFMLGQTGSTANALMRQCKSIQHTKRMSPGSMYIFEYDALHKDTLEYWDKYPLVIPFRQVPGGFYGLNLHYLSPQLRVILLDKLMQYATNKKLDETTKLNFTWQMAAHAAKNKHIASCVKMYLLKQMKSRFLFIEPENWVGGLMLPTENFVGSRKSTVWTDSRRM